VSKQFTAAAILKLEAQGKLATADPIAKFFPKAPEDKKQITIHQVVTHSSGIPVECAWQERDFADRDSMVERVLATPLDAPPGTAFRYSNVGYFLLAALVEKASGQPFEDYLKKHLFAPAGMKDTGFVADRDLDRDRQSARVGDGQRSTVLDYGWNWLNKGATGVVTTVHDLWLYDQALRGDKLLPKAAREKMTRPGQGRYAYGWTVEESLRGTPKVHHGGATRGYLAHFHRFPGESAAVIVLTNADHDPEALADRLESALFGGAELDEAALARCAGTYAFPNGDRIELAVVDGTLEVRATGTQAASRLVYGAKAMPQWPDFLETVARQAEELAKPMRVGDLAAFRALFETPAAGEAAAAVVEACAKSGKATEVVLLGSNSGQEVVSWFRAVFGKTPVTFRVVWSRNRRSESFTRGDAAHPYRLTLAARSASEFVAPCVTRAANIRVVFPGKGKGKPTGLLWFDGTGGEEKGVPCKRES